MPYKDFQTALAHGIKSIEVIRNSQEQLSHFYKKLYTEFDEMKSGIEIDKQVLYKGKKDREQAQDSG